MKKKLAFLLCMTLTLCSTSGAVLAAESEQDADPASALISAADMPPSVSAYPAEVRTSEENGVYHLEKVYYLTAKDDPSTIPTADFEREGRTYTLLDMLKNDQTETDTREHIEVVTLDSKTKDMAEILKMLEPKLEVKAEDGYEGILSLDHTTIQVEAAGYSTSSRTVTAERTYPNLSDADVSLIPKTVNENGRNPFVYVHNEKDVLTLIDNLIKNTTPRNASSNDPFWEKAEIALDSALMLYLISEAPPEERNFETMLYMMNFAEVREDDDQYRSPLDMLFRALEEEQPNHVAVKQYKVFKQAAGKTAKSILVSAAVRLAAFNIPQYARMTMADEMDFGSLGEKKRAIFCVIPIADTSMNYLVGMLYTQCFQELYHRADEKHGGRLPVPVRVIQDEWANVAQPESYPKILATCRSYNIGLNIIVQNIQNIKALYEKEWESIIGNCDTLLFLGGGNEPTSLEFVVKLLGKETLATRTRGQTKGRNGSSSTNFQQTGRELMTLDEVRKLGTNQAILFIRGESPVLDEKYNIKNHPNIRLTVDGKAKPYVHKPQGAPNYALPDLPYEFKSLDDYEFINMEESEHEETEKEDDAES